MREWQSLTCAQLLSTGGSIVASAKGKGPAAANGSVAMRRTKSESGSELVKDMGRVARQRVLQDLELLRHLSPEALDELCRKAHFGKLPAGGRLFSRGGYDKKVFYLLEGRVELCDQNGKVVVIVGGTEESRQPLGPQHARRFTATATTEIQFVSFDADFLEILRSPSNNALSLEEIRPDDEIVENRVFYKVYEDYMADRLEVPSLPDLAVRIRIAVQQPDVGVEDVAKMVQIDPSLVAHLVRIANSALFGGLHPVSDIRDAVMRLGLTATRDQVIAFTLRNLFHTHHPGLRVLTRYLLLHCSVVGATSFVLARLTPGLNPGQALLAGLVHDIGNLVLLKQADNHPALLSQPDQLEAMITKLQGQVGAMVLRKWSFTDELVTVALEAETWERDSGPKPDLCDIVLLAQWHSYIGTPRIAHLPRIATIPAFKKLTVRELTPELSLKVIKEAQEEIAAVQQSLLS